jgi:6-phosphogluconolactonase (cycloisomerase 2 family)
MPMIAIAVLCLSTLLSTAVAAPAATCACDCDEGGSVTIDELVTSVTIALAENEVRQCAAADADGNGKVQVNDLILGVNAALGECRAPIVHPVNVEGVCQVPAARGLGPCPNGTRVRLSRCDDRGGCLDTVDAQTLIGLTNVGDGGGFSFLVERTDVADALLLFSAELDSAEFYRVVELGPAGTGLTLRVAAPSGAGEPVDTLSIVIDPNTEGATRALDAAGLARVDDADIESLPDETRRRSMNGDVYSGLSPGDAADVAQTIAFDVFFISPNAVAISPDGAHVYVTSQDDNAVVGFARKPDGTLELVDVQRVGAGAEAIERPQDLAVSPDGANVYVISPVSNAIAVFARNPVTGALAQIQTVVDGQDGVTGLDSVNGVAMSPEGRHVYAAGRINGTFLGAVSIFSRDAVTGALTFQDVIDGGGLSFLNDVVISADGSFVYASGDSLVVLARNANTGSLSFASPTDVDILIAAGVSPDGTTVYAARCFNGVSVLRRQSDGRLQLSTVVPGFECASFAVVSDDGHNVYVTDSSAACVYSYSRNPVGGGLSFLDSDCDGFGGVEGLSESLEIALSPDGRSAYVAGKFGNGVAVFARDPASGRLEYLELARGFYTRRVGLAGASAVAVSPDDRYVYVGAYSDAAVAVFERDTDDGRLDFVQVLRNGSNGVDGLDGVSAVELSPDGRSLYAAGYVEHALVAFARDAETGMLGLAQVLHDNQDGVEGLQGALAIAISADGAFVYVLSQVDAAVAIFRRDPQTSRLAIVDTVRDDGNDGFHLAGAYDVVLSPDGAHVYVTSLFGAVVAYERDGVTGRLRYRSTISRDDPGTTGLGYVLEGAPTQDGRFIYVVDGFADLVTTLSRDPSSGDLHVAGSRPAGDFPSHVAFGPMDTTLYVATNSGVITFQRDPVSGSLNQVSALPVKVGTLVVSHDGTNVYAVSIDSLTVMARNPNDGRLTVLEVER